MLPNHIKDLLNLEDVIITKIVHADKSVKFFKDTKPKPHICPNCGNSTTEDPRLSLADDQRFTISVKRLLTRSS